jgi:hypothetical protein
LLLLLSLLYPLILVVAVRYPTVMSAVGFLGLFTLMVPVPGVLFAVGQRQIGRRWIRVIPRIAMLSVLGSGMMINTGRAAWQALHAVPGTFERTPKFGRRHEPGDWRRMRYQVAIDRIVILELVLAAVNCASFWMAVRQGSWAIAIYAGLFAAGLLFVDSLTISQTVRSALATRRAGEPVLQPGEPVLHR